MTADIRDYLIDRFNSDAKTLRDRAAMIAASPRPIPGPDAALSLSMARACDEVSGLAELLPSNAPLPEMLAALVALLPELNRRASSPEVAAVPALRAVFAGAATRVQELITAERGANDSTALALDDDQDEDGDET